jgi:hypothetical protein
VTRLTPLAVLVPVSLLLLGYGPYRWSWLAGPVAAIFVWSLDRASLKLAGPAPARSGRREPAPVD